MAIKASLVTLTPKSQEAVIQLAKHHKQQFESFWNFKPKFEEIDRLYHREMDETATNRAAKIANMYGNANSIQNLQIPVVMPQVEAAVTYQTSVFLTGNPIFGVATKHLYQEAGMQMEALIEEQSIKRAWVNNIIMMFRDGFKYNLAAAEVPWDTVIYPTVEETIAGTKPAEVTWSGNSIKRLDMYNTFWDARVLPSEVASKGEFAGYVDYVSKVELKSYLNSLDGVFIRNLRDAYEAPTSNEYYVPNIVRDSFGTKKVSTSNDWNAWAFGQFADKDKVKFKYKNSYERKTIYMRIIPAELGIKTPAEQTPQVWKFVIINNSVLIHAEKLTNAHGLIPIFFIQPYEDGLGYQTKSLATNVSPMQQVSSSLMNSVLDARRKSVYDRNIYDPSLVAKRDMDNPNPIHNIPLKASAYGADINKAVKQLEFRDNQSGLVLSEISTIGAMADTITGQNKAQQGQFVKGNKTLEEYSDVMNNANSRSQLTALVLEAQFFTPVKEVIKLNILQYQGGTKLYSRAKNAEVKVDPVTLRKAIIEFELSDGLIPTEKLLNTSNFQTALQVIGSSPELSARYELGPMVSYLFKSQGADIGQFEKSPERIAYDQAVAQWQQMAMQAFDKGVAFDTPMPAPEQFNLDIKTGKGLGAKPEEPKSIITQVMEQQNA